MFAFAVLRDNDVELESLLIIIISTQLNDFDDRSINFVNISLLNNVSQLTRKAEVTFSRFFC